MLSFMEVVTMKKSIIIIGIASITMVCLSIALSTPMSYVFVGYNKSLFELTKSAFMYYSFSFLFSGFAIFGSSFFTALNNGPISAIISFLRTLLFQVIAVFLLPLAFGVDGIWLSIVVAEFLAVILNVIFLIKNKRRYGY